MNVSIVIVNYNTLQLTCNCINSIIEQTKDIKYEVIVVDNASQDNSFDILQKEYPQFQIIKSEQNVGFGRGNNLGITKAKGKYLLLLNSDTILLNNAVKLFFDFAENHQDLNIGALGCIMLDENGSVQRSSDKLPTLWRIIKWTVIGYFFRFILRKQTSFVQKIIPENKTFMEVGLIVGADMFIPSSVLKDVGLFDDNIFMYYEETDLQKRMQSEEYKRYLIKRPSIIHLEGRSNISVNRYKWYYKSMFYYIKKHKLYIRWFSE